MTTVAATLALETACSWWTNVIMVMDPQEHQDDNDHRGLYLHLGTKMNLNKNEQEWQNNSTKCDTG